MATGAGFVGAMSGMGGGVVLVPAPTLLGMDIKQAITVNGETLSYTVTAGALCPAEGVGESVRLQFDC